jgi:hypothetical protein
MRRGLWEGILRLRLAHYAKKLTRKEHVAAGKFDFEGRMLDYEAKMGMP